MVFFWCFTIAPYKMRHVVSTALTSLWVSKVFKFIQILFCFQNQSNWAKLPVIFFLLRELHVQLFHHSRLHFLVNFSDCGIIKIVTTGKKKTNLRKQTFLFFHRWTQMWGLSDNTDVYANLNIFWVSSKVSPTKAQSNMMICSLMLVRSVKGKITRLSIAPSGPVVFCFTAFTKNKKREGARDFTDGGIEPKSGEKDRSWEILRPARGKVHGKTVEGG